MEKQLDTTENHYKLIFKAGVSYDEKDGFRIDEDARRILAQKIAEISAMIPEYKEQISHTVETLTPEVTAAVIDTMTYSGEGEKKIKKFLTWIQKRISGKLDKGERFGSKIEKKLQEYVPQISQSLYIEYPDGTKESMPFLIHV